MQNVRTDQYHGRQLTVTVEQYVGGPFVGSWFVRSQNFRSSEGGIPAEVAHEQNNGPCGSEDLAFDKGFRTLRRFIDIEIEAEKARRKALGLAE